MKIRLVLLAAVALAGCAVSETVYLVRGSATVQCGPYMHGVTFESVDVQRLLRTCVDDYMRAGYQRAPGQKPQ